MKRTASSLAGNVPAKAGENVWGGKPAKSAAPLTYVLVGHHDIARPLRTIGVACIANGGGIMGDHTAKDGAPGKPALLNTLDMPDSLLIVGLSKLSAVDGPARTTELNALNRVAGTKGFVLVTPKLGFLGGVAYLRTPTIRPHVRSLIVLEEDNDASARQDALGSFPNLERSRIAFIPSKASADSDCDIDIDAAAIGARLISEVVQAMRR